ncbi:E3 ubiquitin-protein ligase TRIM39 [Channa argus]|uniref:E3 ubiquitin-protein ligase TRIM39 n=1 Tax=Channa argus TaxID=215402 RepID=A0A6G1QSF8_CHAAH|nr:E3 ubiquitin-protein ligase TRIM39 [Channa argus]
MATASCLLSEEKFLCSVCLDVFTEPVSTPCGHNFCSGCIHKYWDSSDMCQCPLCNRTFTTKPELHINTIMSELAAQFKNSVEVKSSTSDPQVPENADLLCDMCSGLKEKAVNSCLNCLMSFCELHLEPHQRVGVLKSHKLIEPVSNLDERMCKMHNKIKEMYCRTDQASICVLCIKTDHNTHNAVPLEEEYEVLMAKTDDAMANIQKMIQSRSEKIAEITKSLDINDRDAEKEKKSSVQVFADLIHSIQKSQNELVELIEARHKATKQKGEGFLKELRIEVAELESRSCQLKRLSTSEDHHCFIQNFPTLCSPLNKNWTDVAVNSDLSFEAVRGAVNLLKQRLDKIMDKIPELKMTRMKEHAVDLTLDADTAHSSLVISEDGKQVATVAKNRTLPNNPKRFKMYPEVLAREGFTAGKFYFEVQVKDKIKWALGVVKESVDRQGDTDLSVSDGYWTIGLDEGGYIAYEDPIVAITLKEKLVKVGIFVDYDKGVVSFFDVVTKSHICSFTGCWFTEKLYPYFCPQEDQGGKNSAPIILTPVV